MNDYSKLLDYFKESFGLIDYFISIVRPPKMFIQEICILKMGKLYP